MAFRRWQLAVILPLIALAACDSSTSPNGGQARIYLASSVSSSASVVPGSDFISEAGPLTLATIDSLWVTITAVEVVKAGNDSSASGGWKSIQLDSGSVSRINLMALPGEGADSIRLARGDLKAGTYDHIRLRIDDSATIVLKQDVSYQGNTLAKGSYPLNIPSSYQSGLKIKTASFVIADDSVKAVTLVFDGANSLGNIIMTGTGKLQMSPVLRARNP